jgi:hypothetical protein
MKLLSNVWLMKRLSGVWRQVSVLSFHLTLHNIAGDTVQLNSLSISK